MCPLRQPLLSLAECMLSQCCPQSSGCFCPVITSVVVTATCKNSSHGAQRAASFVTSDAKSASAGKADAVQAEFAKVGISTGVIQRILKQHRPYVSWDIESKLQPTLHLWLQLLGNVQLFQQLQKARRLLVWKPCVQARRSVMWCICGCSDRLQYIAP